MVYSIPQPSITWPQHPEFFLITFGISLSIYGMTLLRLRPLAQRAGRRHFTTLFGLAILIMFCGYYLMYGIANPWEATLYQWMDQQGLNPPTPETLAAATPALEAARHLYVVGFMLFMAGALILPVIFAIWNHRRTRADETGELVEEPHA